MRVRKGGSAQNPSGKVMAPCTFDVKFSSGTQFTFRSLTFTAWEDRNLKILPPGTALECLASVYGQAPCLPAISSTTRGIFSGLDPYVGLHIHTVKLVRGIPIVTSIFQPSAEASSSSSSAASPDQDSTEDYSETEGSTYGDPIEEGRLIIMVARL
jgi:hypothetical protein